jgi:phospholipase/carboxylesterase
MPELAKRVARADECGGLRTLVHHGLHDTLIEVAKARQSVDILRSLHLQATYREYPMGHEISGESLADLSSWLEETLR